MSTLSNEIKHIITPRTADIGGFEVHRALPSRERRMVGPFIFWDQMGPGEFLTDKGVDVRPHPHIGLSTVTYLFSGTLDHKDSLGIDQRITPGDINLMTAGSGIVHSERTGQDIRKGPSDLFGIQSWLALPKSQEERDPAFAHTQKNELPVFEDKDISATLIMGKMWNKSSPILTPSDTLYIDVKLNAGGQFELPRETEERAIYTLHGEIKIGGIAYAPNQLLILKPGDHVTVTAKQDTRLMILGGETMDGPRHIWWNFVSSSRERIEQAKHDWKNGKFDTVKDDKEFIPLPNA